MKEKVLLWHNPFLKEKTKSWFNLKSWLLLFCQSKLHCKLICTEGFKINHDYCTTRFVFLASSFSHERSNLLQLNIPPEDVCCSLLPSCVSILFLDRNTNWQGVKMVYSMTRPNSEDCNQSMTDQTILTWLEWTKRMWKRGVPCLYQG